MQFFSRMYVCIETAYLIFDSMIGLKEIALLIAGKIYITMKVSSYLDWLLNMSMVQVLILFHFTDTMGYLELWPLTFIGQYCILGI